MTLRLNINIIITKDKLLIYVLYELFKSGKNAKEYGSRQPQRGRMSRRFGARWKKWKE